MKTIIEEYQDKKGDYQMRIKDFNNKKIMDATTEGYKNREDMIKAKVRCAHAIIKMYGDDWPSVDKDHDVELKIN